MDGVFHKQGFTKVCNIIGLISGVFLFGFFLFIGEFSTLDDLIISCFFVCFGLFISILCGISLYVNRKAYIHVDDQKITAFCHFGFHLECDLSDVKSAKYGGDGLNIQLKSGKKYNLMNLENAKQLGNYILERIPQKTTDSYDKDKLLSAILTLRKKRKREGTSSVICFALLFPGMILTSALTDWKDLQEFSSSDWIVFSIMLGLGAIVIGAFCILLCKYLLDTDALHKKQGTLCQNILQSAPVQPGNAIKVFISDNINESIRLTIHGYPNSDDVYYTVEQINGSFELECIHISRIYSNISELLPEIEDMTEIALPK